LTVIQPADFLAVWMAKEPDRLTLACDIQRARKALSPNCGNRRINTAFIHNFSILPA
jgi:hypothetical protein